MSGQELLRCGGGEAHGDSLLQHPAGDPAHVHVDGGGCHEAPVADGHIERVQARVKAPRSQQPSVRGGHGEEVAGGGRQAVGERVVRVAVGGVDPAQEAPGVLILGGGDDDLQWEDDRSVSALFNHSDADHREGGQGRFTTVCNLHSATK